MSERARLVTERELSGVLRRLTELEQRLGRVEVTEVPISNIAARVFYSSNQSIVNGGSGTILTFNTEIDDPGGFWDAGTPTRLTIPSAGNYIFGVGATWAGNSTGYRELQVLLNGTTVILSDDRSPPGAVDFTHTTAGRRAFAAGEYIQARAFQNSGAGLNILGFTEFSPIFWIQRVA